MYAITEGIKTINDVKIKTFSRNVKHTGTDLDVGAGTTGLRGYIPREQSSRTYCAIICNEGDFLFAPVTNEENRIVGIEIACCGDGGLMSLVDSLAFVLKTLIENDI